MMKYVLLLLLLCGQCLAQDKEEFSENFGPVLKVRIMQQGRCPKGVPCTPVLVACGSCVLVDSDVASNGNSNYSAVTAAHVVTQVGADRPDGKKNWLLYPSDHYYEVLVNGKWKIARLKYASGRADIAMVTFQASDPLQLVCVSETRPKKDDVLRAVGYKECETLATIPGTSLWTDLGPDAMDAMHKLPQDIVPGMSGGAVLDSSGDLVGVIVGYPDLEMSGIKIENFGSVGVFTGQNVVKDFVDASLQK